MLNFGHLRHTSPPESWQGPDLPSPLFHPGTQSVWPAAEGSQTLCSSQPTAPSSLFPGTFPAPSTPPSGPRCLRRSAGHSGRGYCPEIRSTLCQTIAFRFYHNFRKNTNPNPGGSLTAAFFHGLLTQDLRNSNQ